MNPLSLTTALLLINCFSFFELNAQSCYGHSGLSDDCAKVIDVAVYGDTDRRRTEEEFARDVGEPLATIHNRFAATGTLSCAGSIPCGDDPNKQCPWIIDGSAQLTGGTDVITTASHMLDDSRSCQVIARAENCTFTIVGDGKPQIIPISSLVDQGFKCPTSHTQDLDWAVMKLSRKVKGIIPYRIDASLVMGVKAGDHVLTVCRSKDFVRTNSKGESPNPKHISNCSVKNVYKMYGDPIYFSTDCDSAPLCSGGTLLNGNQNDPALLGMFVDSDETHPELDRAIKSHTVNKHPFDEQTWGARYVPFAGDFLEAIKRANELSATSKDN